MKRTALAALAVVVVACVKRPPVPTLADMGTLAPEVRPLVEESIRTLAADPASGPSWGRFGMICEANGLYSAAHRAYQSAIAVQPAEAKWWYRLASIEARSGGIDEAIHDVRRAIELQPSYVPAHWRLGLWLLDRNENDEAERVLSRAREMDPESVAPGVGLARSYLQRQQDQRAVEILRQTLSRHPDDRYAMQLLARAYQHLGQTADAEFALALSADAQPNWNDPWNAEVSAFERGFAIRLQHSTERFLANPDQAAFAELETIRGEKPHDVALMSHLGEVYVEAHRLDEGIPLLEAAVAKDPERFESFISLATAYLFRNDLPRARAAIDRAVAIHPTLGRAQEIRGAVLARSGDKRGALAALDAAVRYDPRSTRALIWKGRIELQLGRAADARESYARATRLDPTVAEGWLGLSDAEVALGAPDRAAAAIERASRFLPSDRSINEAAQRLATRRP